MMILLGRRSLLFIHPVHSVRVHCTVALLLVARILSIYKCKVCIHDISIWYSSSTGGLISIIIYRYTIYNYGTCVLMKQYCTLRTIPDRCI